MKILLLNPLMDLELKELIRQTLATEKPDILFLFTDPRFFIWLFEMEDEVHQICPIIWWHVWDNYPYPEFNDPFYEATDTLNCHSYLTYEMVSKHYPNKTNFIPHALPENMFFPLPEEKIKEFKSKSIGHSRKDDFICFWMNRNARRKRPNDLLLAWKKFYDMAESKYGKCKASFLMHTDPRDPEGPNLFQVVENLGITDSVIFSTERVGFEQINILHNIADCCINISYAEGFGLATLEAMQTATPIIATKTGGLTRQAIDHRNKSENGIALDVKLKSLVGSQTVPYIYEDYCSIEDTAAALLKMYEMTPEERKKLGMKAKKYVEEEFNYQTTVELWHNSLKNTIENWKKTKRWTCKEY